MKSYSELRSMSRAQLKENWGTPILVCIVFSLILIVLNLIPHVGSIATLILTGPLMLGFIYFFVNFVRGENPKIDALFLGFDNLGKSLGLYLLQGLFVFLWSLLLIIPGIIAQFRYAMAFYILKDNPEIGVKEALTQSSEMMNGYKINFFILNLTFIGWFFLSCLTCGIGLLWFIPYISTTQANFYNELKQLNQTEIPPQIKEL